MPGSLHPYTHADSFLLQLPIESLGVTIFMVQSPFSALTGFFNKKSNLLKTRVVIYAYNHHVRLLSPESLVVRQPSLLGSRSRHCYAIMWICAKSSCPDSRRNQDLGTVFEISGLSTKMRVDADPESSSPSEQLVGSHRFFRRATECSDS